MSVPETPAGPLASGDPATTDPAVHVVRRRGLGPVVWILLGVGLACVLAGLGVARYGPVLFPASPAAPVITPPPAVPVSSIDARLADIQVRLAAQGDAQAARDQVVTAAAQVDALSERLDRIERRQQGALDAAAAALAVASLDQAAVGSGSFAVQLAAVERFLPASADLRGLRALAEGGAPSRAALAAEFPDVAARAATAAHAGVQGDGLGARIARALASVVTIRRIDRATGQGLDAVLVRAEAKANDGDLEAALAELSALPPAAQTATADWRRRAARRAEIDRRLASIRAQALQQLAQRQQEIAPPPFDGLGSPTP